jgi:hypothetical protein
LGGFYSSGRLAVRILSLRYSSSLEAVSAALEDADFVVEALNAPLILGKERIGAER